MSVYVVKLTVNLELKLVSMSMSMTMLMKMLMIVLMIMLMIMLMMMSMTMAMTMSLTMLTGFTQSLRPMSKAMLMTMLMSRIMVNKNPPYQMVMTQCCRRLVKWMKSLVGATRLALPLPNKEINPVQNVVVDGDMEGRALSHQWSQGPLP